MLNIPNISVTSPTPDNQKPNPKKNPPMLLKLTLGKRILIRPVVVPQLPWMVMVLLSYAPSF